MSNTTRTRRDARTSRWASTHIGTGTLNPGTARDVRIGQRDLVHHQPHSHAAPDVGPLHEMRLAQDAEQPSA